MGLIIVIHWTYVQIFRQKYLEFYSKVKSTQTFVLDAFNCTFKMLHVFVFLFHSGQLSDSAEEKNRSSYVLWQLNDCLHICCTTFTENEASSSTRELWCVRITVAKLEAEKEVSRCKPFEWSLWSQGSSTYVTVSSLFC